MLDLNHENGSCCSGQAIKVMEEAGLEPETCEKFLLVHSRVLHGQHAHMLDVKHSLLHLLGHHEGFLMAELSDKHLQYKEEIARTILSVADKVLPGELKGLYDPDSALGTFGR